MRAKFMLLGLLMCCLFSSAALAQTNSVSKADALAIAQRQLSIENGVVIAECSLTQGYSEISINIPNCNGGIYTVSYLVNNAVVDSRKITVTK